MSHNSTNGSNQCDDDSLSIDAMKEEIESLVKRKFELETQLFVHQPLKFGNLLENLHISSPTSDTNYFEDSQQFNFKTKMHFYELCGIYVKEDDNEIKVCFRSIHNDKEYFVWIKKSPDHIEVTKYFLPPIVPVEALVEIYLKNKKNVRGLFRKIYHYIVVFDDRINQINIFKNSKDSKNIDLFVSHSTHYVKLEMNLEDESSKRLRIHLKYQPDFVFPLKIMLDGGGMTIEEKVVMMEKCQAFKRMSLLEAARKVLLTFDEET